MKRTDAAIGVFDSGIGGLTVMRQMMQCLPVEQFIYFGDTARVPYGEKSRETVIRYSIENSIFLMEQEIKMLVVACNTASAYAIEKLRQIFNIPVVGVVEPGVHAVLEKTKSGRIGVLGTKGTINSGIYQREIARSLPEAYVVPIACPLFVPLVEERLAQHPATRLLVKEYLAPLKKENVDTLLLACTHYPLLESIIQEEMGEGVVLVDSASTCADQVNRLLQEKSMGAERGSGVHMSPVKFFVSDDPEKFRTLGQQFLGIPLSHVEMVTNSH